MAEGLGFFSRVELETISAPTGRIPLCGKCGLYKGCKSPKMGVKGEGKKGILIVGEAPGENEDLQGKPFVGMAGQKLQSVLRQSGIEMFRDCWVTNALSCRPKDNRITTPKSIDWCRPLVLNAIEKHQPTVIILAGLTAVKSVAKAFWSQPIGKAGRWTGWTIPMQKWNCWIAPIMHPSFLNRQHEDPVAEREFRDHIRAAVKLADTRPWPDSGPPDLDSKLEMIVSPKEAAIAIRKFRGKTIAWDLETTTLKPHAPAAEIVCCSVSDGKTSISFPWYGPAMRAMLDLVRDKDTPKIGWNLKFETVWILVKHGFLVRGWVHDGMTSAHGLDNRSNITGLEFQELVRYGITDHKRAIGNMLKAKSKGGNSPNRIREIPLSRLLKYNALDSLIEYKIARQQMKEIPDDE